MEAPGGNVPCPRHVGEKGVVLEEVSHPPSLGRQIHPAALDSALKWKLEQELRDFLDRFPGPALWVSHDLGEVHRTALRRFEELLPLPALPAHSGPAPSRAQRPPPYPPRGPEPPAGRRHPPPPQDLTGEGVHIPLSGKPKGALRRGRRTFSPGRCPADSSRGRLWPVSWPRSPERFYWMSLSPPWTAP